LALILTFLNVLGFNVIDSISILPEEHKPGLVDNEILRVEIDIINKAMSHVSEVDNHQEGTCRNSDDLVNNYVEILAQLYQNKVVLTLDCLGINFRNGHPVNTFTLIDDHELVVDFVQSQV
jgi:hypothetical protein